MFWMCAHSDIASCTLLVWLSYISDLGMYGMKERHTCYSFLGNSINTVDSSCYVPLLITPMVRKWALNKKNGRLTGSGILKT